MQMLCDKTVNIKSINQVKMLGLFWMSVILTLSGLELTLCLMFKYEVELLSDAIYTPCDEYPDKSIDNFIDNSGMNIDLNNDGSHTLQGQVKIIQALQQPQHKFSMEMYKRERGAWQKTLYSVRRKDFCNALFSSAEVWAPYVSHVPVDERKCPFEKDMIYNLNFTTNEAIELPDGKLAGEYKVHLEIGDSAQHEFTCFDILVNIYRQ